MEKKSIRDSESQYIADLMATILKVRFTDLEQEKDLCKQLLKVAEAEKYDYGCAFASVYLMDSCLALGEYKDCDFYLVKASFLCQEFEFNDLRLVLCNIAGLYYLKLNDEQTALEYYLEGLELSIQADDHIMESKIYNNVGKGFAGRDDWETAKEYFSKAYEKVRLYEEEAAVQISISYLSNFAEASKMLGDVEDFQRAIDKCESLVCEGNYHKIRYGCERCSLYASRKDRDNCIKEADKVMELGLLNFDNKFFICDMVESLCSDMLEIDEKERAKEFINILRNMGKTAPLANRYQIQCLQIQFFLKYGEGKENVYREYYEVVKQLSELEDEARAQSMLSKIQINTALLEHESLHKETKKLEDVSRKDELTGLFNRRYFNKLVSKVAQSSEIKTLGFIMVDVDYFKQFNDFYGHFDGDDALRTVGHILASNASEGIHVSRYGGDEFVCLCVDQPDEKLKLFVEKVEQALREKAIFHEKSTCSDRLSLSIGYCNESCHKGMKPEQLLLLADSALYKVKESGRNGHQRLRGEDLH